MVARTKAPDPVTAWPGPAPEDITSWNLVQAGHVAGRHFVVALGRLGLSPTQFGVLLQLNLNPGMSNGEIARSVLVTPQTMSELVASLARSGLVERQPSTGRGHRIPARLTAAGEELLEQCAEAVAHVELQLGLTSAELARLNTILHKVIRQD